ncbi:hypothetical protein M0R45_019616 [Rubus argutus]|uniref:Uncharacterized protein n=1 Tax=Rubus argutus TaxID=59490 RepID=A0AAW1X7Y4_RUBAR
MVVILALGGGTVAEMNSWAGEGVRSMLELMRYGGGAAGQCGKSGWQLGLLSNSVMESLLAPVAWMVVMEKEGCVC